MLIAALAIAFMATAQQAAKKESFAEFRERIHSDFRTFRKSILDDYDRFLDGAWKNYEQIKGEARDNTPKPHTPPTVDDTPLPAAKSAPAVSTPDMPVAPDVQPSGIGALPHSEATPHQGSPAYESDLSDSFLFGESTLLIRRIDFNILPRLNTAADYAMQWRALKQSGIADTLVETFRNLAERYGLNDFLTFQAVNAYVDSRFPSAHSSARKSLVHFILAHMGYDIRIARSSSGHGILLVPFEQQVYAQPFSIIDGTRYYLFTDASASPSMPENMQFATCDIPTGAEQGRRFNLLIHNLRLPYAPQPYTLSYADISITGEFNRAVLPHLYRYPQMNTGDYAACNVLPEVRAQIVSRFKEHLASLPLQQAVDKLLSFMHNAFSYATDEDFHGFEKPYFLEEMLFYPKNDCEDRAIFYTCMLWEVLGVPNQLIAYPGHEAAAVALPSDPGTHSRPASYSHSGTTFYISDPTYIGSVTGMCIPQYEATVPHIDFTYR